MTLSFVSPTFLAFPSQIWKKIWKSTHCMYCTKHSEIPLSLWRHDTTNFEINFTLTYDWGMWFIYICRLVGNAVATITFRYFVKVTTHLVRYLLYRYLNTSVVDYINKHEYSPVLSLIFNSNNIILLFI